MTNTKRRVKNDRYKDLNVINKRLPLQKQIIIATDENACYLCIFNEVYPGGFTRLKFSFYKIY